LFFCVKLLRLYEKLFLKKPNFEIVGPPLNRIVAAHECEERMLNRNSNPWSIKK
jgi:hypothetical protein